MTHPRPVQGPALGRPDLVLTVALFAAAFAIFWASPVRYWTDARYTLLLSEQLLRRQTFRLDDYFSPATAGVQGQAHYNLQRAGDRVYFRPAPGSAIFSAPFLPVLRLFGLSALDAEGRYDAAGELRAQAVLAALLMAALTVLFFLTARLLLPAGWSLAVAVAGSLGTQVWSTASRALWSHTWEIAVIGFLVWRLARAEVRGRSLNPFGAVALLSAAFLARPTAAGHAIAVLAYAALFRREMLWRLLVGGAAVLGAFVAASWAIFGQVLPSAYFVWHRASPSGTSLATALVSPSRGLLVCVPLVLLVAVLIVRYREHVPSSALLFVGASGFALQIAGAGLAVAWWSGHSYGPRLSTGSVPWLVLLGVLAIRAHRDGSALRAGARRSARWASWAALALTTAASIFIHGRGALSAATQRWNLRPTDVDHDRGRVWDWRYPQWLAGVIPAPAGPPLPLPLGRPLMVGDVTAEVYLREGWSWPEPERRWIDEDSASTEFVLDADGPLLLGARLERPPWEAADRVVEVELNGRAIATWVLESRAPAPFVTPLDGARRGANRLTLRALGGYRPAPAAADERHLRAGVRWLRVDAHPTLPRGNTVSLGQDDAVPFVGSGWGDAEGDYRWTVSPRADLYFAAEALPPGILRLKAHAYPVSTRGAGQRVFVSVNDALVHTFALTGAEPALKSVPLPAGIPRLGRVTLDLPDLAPEAPPGESRRLGTAVHWVRYDAFPVLRPGERVDLGAPSGAAFLGEGWAEPENGRRWTLGTSAEVYFAAEPGRSDRLILVLDAFLHRRLPAQRVRFELNGERLGEITIADAGRRPVELTLPPGALQAVNVLRVLLPDARSPASIGVSRDARVLGVRVGGLELGRDPIAVRPSKP